MGKLAFETLKSIFGGTFIENSTKLMTSLIAALKEVFTTESVSGILTIFISISVTLLTLFLFIEIANKATTEQLTLERLIMILVKFFAACIIIANIFDIIMFSFNISMAVYETVEVSVKDSFKGENNFGDLKFFPEQNKNPEKFPEKYDTVKKAFEQEGYGESVLSIIGNMSAFITCLLFKMCTFVINCGSFLIIIGNAISLIVRTVFAPIALTQLMEDGSKSAGIRYLKKFLADGLTLAAILAVLYATSRLQASLISVSIPADWHNTISATSLDTILNLGVLGGGIGIMLIALQLASVGAMFKASQIANDIVGI